VKADAAFAGSASVVMLHTIPEKDPHGTIIHTNWNLKTIFSTRPAKHLRNLGVQHEQVSDTIELGLGHLEGINHLGHVFASPKL
jgi:hypothetical protein